jgi:hypothetical protein
MAGAGQKPNVSPSAAPDGDDLAYAAMIGRAKALIPQLRERGFPDRRIAASAAGDRTRFA